MKSAALAEVCTVIMGQAPAGDTYNERGDGLPLIAGAGDFEGDYPRPKKYTTANNVRVSEPGDVIVGIRASIGAKVLADDVYCLGRGVAGLRAGPLLEPRYLWHWVAFAVPMLAAKGRGATFLQVNKNDIAELEIGLPPIEEQRRIASILDAADALRSKRRQALEKLDTLTQSIFIDMFGGLGAPLWQATSVHFSDLLAAPLRNGVSPAKSGTIEADVLSLSAITGSSYNRSAVKRSTFARPHSSQITVSQDDFLICRGNGNLSLVGRGRFPTCDAPLVAFPDTMIAARCDRHRLGRAYLEMIWNGPLVRRRIESLARTTNGTFKINQEMIESIEIPVPPIEVQIQFESAVGSVMALRAGMEQSGARLHALFASLEQRAFRGDL